MNLLNLFASQPKIFDISSVKYKKPIDQQLVNKLIDYLQHSHKYLSKLGLSKIMTGMNEGINSLVAATLLKQALGENIVAMIIDFDTDPVQTNNIIELCQHLNLEAYVLKRGATYRDETLACHSHTPSSTRHFLKRFTNYHLFTQADNMKAVLVDTLDKSERLLSTRPEGFYGYFMPFYSLYKSELGELANFLGIPNLKFSHPSTYQDLLYPDNIALSWDKIDPVLFLLTEKQLTPEEVSQQLNIDLHWLKKLKSRLDKQLLRKTVSQFII